MRFGARFAILFFLLPLYVHAAALDFGGARTVTAGQSITLPVLLSTAGGESANAVSATVEYPASLELISISKAGSIITLWPAEPSQSVGSAHFEGVILNPGWSGVEGVAVRLTFVAKTTGLATVSFKDPSVLANDGQGTEILKAANPASVTIEATAPSTAPRLVPTITSSTHPNQTQTYSAAHVVLDWTNSGGVTGVRLGYDKFASGKPTVLYADPISHKEIDLGDGVWYFHVQERDAAGWGSVATFKIQINTVLPPASPASGPPQGGNFPTGSIPVPEPVVASQPPPAPAFSLVTFFGTPLPLGFVLLALLAVFEAGWIINNVRSRRKTKKAGK